MGLSPMMKRLHLDFSVISNESVIAQLKRGETYHRVTRRMCDCGTALGSMAAPNLVEEDPGDAVGRKIRKLQSKGWSKSKIDRWLVQHDETVSRKDQRAKEREVMSREQGTPDVEWWLSILKEVIDSGKTTSVGLLIHWYSGRLESERIQIHERSETSIDDTSPELLLNMKHDTLYEFTR